MRAPIFVDIAIYKHVSGHQELLLSFDTYSFRIDLGMKDEYNVSEIVESVKIKLDIPLMHDKMRLLYGIEYNVIKIDSFKNAFVSFLLDPEPTWHFFTSQSGGFPHWSYPLGFVMLDWEE